ncbi:MAG: hypothetical protein M9939_20695 [Mesorhizobium sp.]|nr:hypothetical protein [Mesorhizobium sp.]MCO5163554.1 hypothetical protein [Mesorhizobium sp.]
MKVGPHIEGTPEEIRNLFSDKGSMLDQFLTVEPPRIPSKLWLAGPAVVFVALALSCRFVMTLHEAAPVVFFLAMLMTAAWVSFAAHVFFEKWVATWLLFIALFSVALVAAGFVEPKDLPSLLEKAKD